MCIWEWRGTLGATIGGGYLTEAKSMGKRIVAGGDEGVGTARSRQVISISGKEAVVGPRTCSQTSSLGLDRRRTKMGTAPDSMTTWAWSEVPDTMLVSAQAAWPRRLHTHTYEIARSSTETTSLN